MRVSQSAVVIAALGLLAACQNKPTPEKADDQEASQPVRREASKGERNPNGPMEPIAGDFAPLDPPDWGDIVAPRIEPKLPAQDSASPYAMGWAEDGGDFGLCVHPAGETCSECIFADRAGGETQLSDCDDASNTQAIKDRLEERKYADARGQWKFNRAWLVWDVIDGNGGSDSARLRFGASVDSRIPVYDHNITKPEHKDLHPELISVSASGNEVGIISHSTAPNGTDAWEVRVVDAGAIVAAAENGAGLFATTREDYNLAKLHYHRAAHADLNHPWAMYNLACTLARDEDPATEAALKEALARNDEGVRPKLDSDEDLEKVRGEDWFKGL